MFELAWPWVLILLPLPLLVRYGLSPVVSTKQALKLPFFDRLTGVTESHTTANTTSWGELARWLIWFALVIAVSGPQWTGAPITLPQKARNMILAMDLSGSMQTTDMQLKGQPVTRLAVVKSVASRFIHQRQGDRIGLILFGSQAYLQAPLTFDHETVQYLLSDATVGLAGQTTSIGDAIALAVKRFKTTPGKAQVLVLLTDGVNNSGNINPLQAAEIAKSQHIKIYTIGLGASQLVVQSMFGQQVINPSQDLDETTLTEIATTTGGKFFRATDPKQLQTVFADINQLEPINVKTQHYRPIVPLYPYPLAVGLMMLGLWLLEGVIRNLFQRFAFKTAPAKPSGEMS